MPREKQYLMEGEEPIRSHYGNACSKCFCSADLFVCECKEVRYCSIRHQNLDKKNHEKICTFLKNRRITAGMDPVIFFTQKFMCLTEMRLLMDPYPLTQFEKDLCMVPWACLICFKRDNLFYGCEVCHAVPYCSVEHRAQDAKMHDKYCKRLLLLKITTSLPYENGNRIRFMKLEYRPIREKEKHFPDTQKGLMKMIQKRVLVTDRNHEILNAHLFSDRFAAAATILSVLKVAGVITRRLYNWLPTKKLVPMPKKRNKLGGTLVIHMLHANEYEMKMKWDDFVGLILDWLINVIHIKIILIGRDLQFCQPPKCDAIKELVTFEIHPKDYCLVYDKVETPDLIVLFNFGYPKMFSYDEFVHKKGLKFAFERSKVPVIITSAYVQFITKLSFAIVDVKEQLKKIDKKDDVEIIYQIRVNEFSEFNGTRYWDHTSFQVGRNNELVTAFRRL